MLLANNYKELQNIKDKIIKDNIKDEKEILYTIITYKEAINYIFENKLVDLTKEELEKDLNNFVKLLLKNTNKSYDELCKEYLPPIASYHVIKSNEIKISVA